jgi:hypothetical protein
MTPFMHFPRLQFNKNLPDRRLAHILGIVGLLPFVLISLICWIVHPGWLGAFIRGQLAYGIAILAFMGGIHWGAAVVTHDMSAEQTKKVLLWGVIPPLSTWIAVLFDIGLGFAVMMACFIITNHFDKRFYKWYHMPDWLLLLRHRLTWVIVASLLLTFLAVNIRI